MPGPAWNREYVSQLADALEKVSQGLGERIEGIAAGQTAPAVDDIPIGSGRKVRASVLFFDIRGFTSRTSSADLGKLKQTLYMLDVVIPMVMQVVFDHDGYVEKNTGDGVMALFGIEGDDASRSNTALNVATTSFYVLRQLVNPHLERHGIGGVDARIGVAMGTLLLARIGKAKGSAKHDRSHLTAVGTPSNLGAKLQQMAGTNQIWVDDLVKTNARSNRRQWFKDRTPADWSWSWVGHGKTYRLWHYDARRNHPTT